MMMQKFGPFRFVDRYEAVQLVNVHVCGWHTILNYFLVRPIFEESFLKFIQPTARNK